MDSLVEFVSRLPEDLYAFLIFGRVWACILGIGTVVLTARLGEALGARGWGWLAGLILAVAPLHVRESHYGTQDIPSVFFLTASLLFTLRAAASRKGLDVVLCGVFLGLTAAHRYQWGVVAVAYPLAEALKNGPSWPSRFRRVTVAATAALAAFIALNPQLVTYPGETWQNIAGALQTVYAWTGPPSLPATDLLALGIGAFPCLAALVGAVLALQRDWRTALPVLAVVVLGGILVFQSQRVFARYTLLFVPIVAAFASVSVVAIRDRLPQAYRAVPLTLLVCALVAAPFSRSLRVDSMLARTDTRWLARSWLNDNLATDTRLWVSGGLFFAHQSLPSGVQPTAVPEHRAGHSNVYVMTVEHPGLPFFGQVPDELWAWLASRAVREAQFVGTLAAGNDALGVYDPTDANYLPLGGFGAVQRPGPNIEIWRVRETGLSR